jgi:hypothetical protein
MRRNFLKTAIAVGTIQMLVFPQALRAEGNQGECRFETGVIRPGHTSDQIKAGALKGPFLLTMLQSDVDPASPKREFVIWSTENRWIAADDFKGQFYLGKDEMLMGRDDFTTRGVIYSGCRQ